MREPEVTDEEILKAGRAIAATGRRVTGHGLRTAIGSGNPKRMMAVWSELSLALAPDKDKPSPEMPAEIIDSIKAISDALARNLLVQGGAIYQASMKVSEQRAQESCRVMAEEMEQLRAELEDAEISEQRADDKNQALTEQLSAQRQELAMRSEDLAKARAQIEVLEQKLGELSKSEAQVRITLDAVSQQMADTKTLLAVEKENNKALSARITDQAGRIDEQCTELNNKRHQVSRLIEAEEKLKHEASSLATQNADLQTQLAVEKENNKALSARITDQAGRIDEQCAELNNKRQQVSRLIEAEEKLKHEASSLASLNANLQAQLAELRGGGSA